MYKRVEVNRMVTEIIIGQLCYRLDTQNKVISRFMSRGDEYLLEMSDEPVLWNQMAAEILINKWGIK